MRKLAALLVSAALTTGAVAATAGPASASTTRTASVATKADATRPATYRISNARCYSDAIDFTAKQIEHGYSGVTRFEQVGYEEEYVNGTWEVISNTYTSTSNRFPNNGASYSYTLNWNFDHDSDGASYRVLWFGYWFSGKRIAYDASQDITCLS